MPSAKVTLACAALLAACLVGPIGCHNGNDGALDANGMPDTSGMSKEQVLAKGDSMIQQGEALKASGQQLPPGQTRDGMSRDDLMMRGDVMIKAGMNVKDKGQQM